jgi:hypothetical protein
MKTTYSVTLTNGETDRKVSSVPDYVVGIQGMTWKGDLRLISLSKKLGDAVKTAARLSASGMESVKILDLSRE